MADDIHLFNIAGLSPAQANALRKGGLTRVIDLFVRDPRDLVRDCGLTAQEYKDIIGIVCEALSRPPRLLADVIMYESSIVFTTGDVELDKALGGGIKTGMLWELVGEGASGKTQLALQLSLCVQLPIPQGGLRGSACYLTTHTGLPTPRLLEIYEEHPLLTGSSASLEHIHTMDMKSVHMMLLILSTTLPGLLASSSTAGRPVKLLIIDSLADLFSDNVKASTAQLAERSRNLSEIATQLHILAQQHQLAVVVVNHVVDTWERAPGASDELIYAHQARFFNSTDSVAGESRKSAALGLVWANQINARIMLTRTGRRRHLDVDHNPDSNRRRVVSGNGQSIAAAGDNALITPQDILIRRMSLLFSSVSPPFSADFIVTPRGVELYAEPEYPPSTRTAVPNTYLSSPHKFPSRVQESTPPVPRRLGDVALLDVACAETDLTSSAPQEQSFDEALDEEKDEEEYWKEFGDLQDADYVELEGEVLHSVPQDLS